MQLGRLDAIGYFGDGGNADEDEYGDGMTAATGGREDSVYAKRDMSLELEARYLRTLACRAGVLGAIAAKEDVAVKAEMDVEGMVSPRCSARWCCLVQTYSKKQQNANPI